MNGEENLKQIVPPQAPHSPIYHLVEIVSQADFRA